MRDHPFMGSRNGAAGGSVELCYGASARLPLRRLPSMWLRPPGYARPVPGMRGASSDSGWGMSEVAADKARDSDGG
jgi:hypothetical protein